MKMHHGRVACTSKSSIRQEQQAPWTSTWSVNRLRYRPREGAAAAHSIVAQTARRKKCEMISAFHSKRSRSLHLRSTAVATSVRGISCRLRRQIAFTSD